MPARSAATWMLDTLLCSFWKLEIFVHLWVMAWTAEAVSQWTLAVFKALRAEKEVKEKERFSAGHVEEITAKRIAGKVEKVIKLREKVAKELKEDTPQATAKAKRAKEEKAVAKASRIQERPEGRVRILVKAVKVASSKATAITAGNGDTRRRSAGVGSEHSPPKIKTRRVSPRRSRHKASQKKKRADSNFLRPKSIPPAEECFGKVSKTWRRRRPRGSSWSA